ncbi:MAG: hypothetical protein II661_03280 [Bacteroidales bacterium]|nr:hypothetical protein [Bacteroidales bacterium]
MATFGQIVYSVLDILKERSDDSFYTEEHILFLASKMRAVLLERKYRNSRNQTFSLMPEANKQLICLDLEPAEMLPYGCEGPWLKSTKKVPELMGTNTPTVNVINDLMFSPVTYIAPERMPYVGFNKWLQHIIYASRSNDGYLYMKSSNPQFINLEKAQLSAVFANPEEAAALACDPENDKPCDIMEQEFPLEDSLIPSCIELVIQELTGARYAPDDRNNNANDDLARVGVASTRAPQPAETLRRRSGMNTPEQQE